MTLSSPGEAEGRRPHLKSRKGCLVCKKRRVKCDETRPRCRKCALGNRPCSYRNETPKDSSSASDNQRQSPADSAITAPLPVITDAQRLVAEHFNTGTNAFTTIHMALLNHAHNNLGEFMGVHGDIRPLIDEAVGSASTAPYVLDQLLALSALHYATQNPDKASAYYHQATELQTRALEQFNRVREDISTDNYLSSFLFASCLGIHVLHTTLANHHHVLGDFVASFVDYARVHRGVRTVTDTYWERIVDSSLKPLLSITEWADRAENMVSGTETTSLVRFLESSQNISPSSLKACLLALKWVQWALNMATLEPSRPDLAIHSTVAWPVVIPDEYIEALHQHRPEALVVLAHFAANMHKQPKFWVFGSSGSTLVQLITDHVGPFWTDALIWPHQIVSGT